MPIAFACSCGKSFRVADAHAGKSTRCPVCQQPLVVPAASAEQKPSPPTPAAPPADSLTITCACGKAFRVKKGFAGKRVRCPSCQAPMQIPAPEPAPTEEDIEAAAAAAYGMESDVDVPTPSAEDPDDDGYEPVEDDEKESAPEDDYEAVDEDEPDEPERPARKKPKPVSAERYQHIGADKPTSLQEFFYWGLLIFLIPLGLSLVIWDDDPSTTRFQRTLENAPADVQIRVIAILERIDEGEASPDELIAALPGERIEGAHLGRGTFLHWLYALASILVFLFVAMILFPEAGKPLQLFGIGLFTGTIGVLLLLGFQFLAQVTQNFSGVGGNVVIMFLFWVIKLIGLGYRAAMDSEIGFMGSLMGFTFGVGLCEELVKALPVIWYYRRPGLIGWREACTWGFASGAGFGVAEGIMYSADFYNGLSPFGIYLVRFVSCVALHAIWTASVALFIHKFQYLLQEEMDWHDWPARLLLVIAVPMILHGLYDTFLKKDMNGWALATALLSFGWFVWRIEVARGLQDGDYQPRKKKKKKARAEFA